MLGPAGTGRSQHNLTLGLVVLVENVLRLEISVYNTTLVEILDSGEELGHYRGCQFATPRRKIHSDSLSE